MSRNSSIVLGLLCVCLGACKGGPGAADAASSRDLEPRAVATGCDHDLESDATVEHSWPYPADMRNLRWVGRYKKVHLKLKPTHAAFHTATLVVRKDDRIEPEDSFVHVTKPRRLVAKRDLYVTRKVWDQGFQVERRELAAAKGELGSFLFYNSRGMCLLDTDRGTGWVPCTLDDSFEGLSAESPFACEQTWWIELKKSKLERGWLRVDPALMERLPEADAAK